MPERPEYRRALGHVFDAIRDHGDGGRGRLVLSRLRASLSRHMDEDSAETLLQYMVLDELLHPARADGTVALTAAGLAALHRSNR